MTNAALRTFARLCVVAIAGVGAGCQGSASPGQAGAPMRLGDDLLASGPEIRIADDVPGDAILAGSEIEYAGSTGGDLLSAGGTQRIGGRIAGSVRAAGGEIRLGAPVGRNVTLAGGQVTVDSVTRVEGNAYVAAGQVTLAGEIGGFLVATGGEVVIDGVVGGDARIRASSVRLGPSARIAGDLRVRTPGAAVTMDPGARVDGEVIAEDAPPLGRTFRFLRMLMAIGFLVAGGVAVAVAPGRADAGAALVRRRPLVAAGLGLAVLILAPIAVLLVGITIVGIPLALIAGVLYAICVYLARAVVAVWLGRLILRDRAPAGRKGALAAFLLGGVLLLVIRLVPVIGGLIGMVATIIGLGAMALIAAGRDAPPEASAA